MTIHDHTIRFFQSYLHDHYHSPGFTNIPIPGEVIVNFIGPLSFEVVYEHDDIEEHFYGIEGYVGVMVSSVLGGEGGLYVSMPFSLMLGYDHGNEEGTWQSVSYGPSFGTEVNPYEGGEGDVKIVKL